MQLCTIELVVGTRLLLLLGRAGVPQIVLQTRSARRFGADQLTLGFWLALRVTQTKSERHP